MNQPEPKLQIPLTERLKAIPEIFGIRLNEEPAYLVLQHDGAFERRRYDSQLRASVTLSGLAFDEFRETAFMKLAAYIFGGNSKSSDMAMTAPVLQRQTQSENIAMTAPVLQRQEGLSWTMEFILPRNYRLSNVPKPVDPDVKVLEVPSYEVAAVTYSGNNTQEKIKDHEAELKAWVRHQAGLAIEGESFSAQYDAPFVIPFLKKNEVQVKVRSLQS